MSPQQLATVALALVKLGVSKVSKANATSSEATSSEATSSEATSKASSRAAASDRRTLKRLSRHSRARLAAFNAQDLDNLASAFARAGRWRAPTLVRDLANAGADAITKPGAGFPSRNLANLVGAVAKLYTATRRDMSSPTSEAAARAVARLASVAASAVRSRIADFNLRDLANTACGLAAIGQVKNPNAPFSHMWRPHFSHMPKN